MENKPDTETQEQNTQSGIGPVTATQPLSESPDVIVRQRPEPLEYIRVEDIHGWPVYFQTGHEDESPDVIMRQHKLAQDYAQVTGKQQPPVYLLIGHEDEFQSEIDEIRLRNLSNHGSESTQDKETTKQDKLVSEATPPDDIWGAAWNTGVRSYEGQPKYITNIYLTLLRRGMTIDEGLLIRLSKTHANVDPGGSTGTLNILHKTQ